MSDVGTIIFSVLRVPKGLYPAQMKFINHHTRNVLVKLGMIFLEW